MRIPSAVAPILFVFAAALCGCANPYFLVESRLVESTRHVSTAEVTDTPIYRAIISDVKTIGLRPPDACAEGSISAGTRGETGDPRMLRARCGVEMAEFEQALARAGYVVTSWNLIRHKADLEGKPPLVAARELGVHVLLQVNALERGATTPGRDARWERRFYHSSEEAVVGDAAKVERSRAKTFVNLIRPEEERLGAKRLTATINASAVRVQDGATIWFYRWTHVDLGDTDANAQLLVFCDDDRCAPAPKSATPVSSGPVEGDVELFSKVEAPEDVTEATYQRLIRDVVDDLVWHFSGG